MVEQATVASAARPTGWAVARIAGGIAILGVGFLGAFFAGALGLDGLRLVLPLLMLVGLVVLGTGVHRLMWEPPRESSVPPSLRPVISAAIALGAAMCLSFIAGLAAGLLRAHR